MNEWGGEDYRFGAKGLKIQRSA